VVFGDKFWWKVHRFVLHPIVRSLPLKSTHSFYQAKHTILAFTSKVFTNGATTDYSSHLIAFIDPVRMKCLVGVVSWPTADGLLIWILNVYPSLAGQGKFASQRPTFYHRATPWWVFRGQALVVSLGTEALTLSACLTWTSPADLYFFKALLIALYMACLWLPPCCLSIKHWIGTDHRCRTVGHSRKGVSIPLGAATTSHKSLCTTVPVDDTLYEI